MITTTISVCVGVCMCVHRKDAKLMDEELQGEQRCRGKTQLVFDLEKKKSRTKAAKTIKHKNYRKS